MKSKTKNPFMETRMEETSYKTPQPNPKFHHWN